MLDAEIEGAVQNSNFDRNRFVGVAGREAFHVFDLKKMNFVIGDKRNGYVNLLNNQN